VAFEYHGGDVAGRHRLGVALEFTLAVNADTLSRRENAYQMHAKLTNENGVVMYLAGETEGLASSMGAQAFEVNLIN
jgi:hypothetical protein